MRLVILYGSQTGTAQDVAEQIWRESKKWGCTGPVLPMDEYPIQQLTKEEFAVFVVATTGNGDEPDNMRHTWNYLLRRSLHPQSLQYLQYACLGLGDSSYVKFNYAAKKLNKRIQMLGAGAVMPLGLCDDQHDYGLSAVALPWIGQLWKQLASLLKVEQKYFNKDANNIFKWNLQILEQVEKLPDLDYLHLPTKDKKTSIPLALKNNLRTTADSHFQDVRLMQFVFPNGTVWNPGDIVQLQPCNSDTQVASFFSLVEEHQLGFNADTVVQLSSAFEDMPLPLAYSQPLTVGQLAKYVWDFSNKPRQRAFELLALNCEDELEKEKLLEFTTAEGLDSLINYINRPRRTILEVLEDFRHATAKLSLPILFELFPIIQVRSFSIASMPTAGTLDLLVAVVEYKTKLSTPRLGLCSNWLKDLETETLILGAIKSGTMCLPKDILTPLIMVGPGTGVAPFRSIIQSRDVLKQNGIHIGPLILFFGCRYKMKDCHFFEDLVKWQASNLVEVHIAYSRDQEQKVYVQHLIRNQKFRLRELIQKQNAFIYVAGSSNTMPKEVKEAFTFVLDGDEAYVEHMVKADRYQEETWS